MISLTRKNFSLVRLFKAAMIVHILCLMANLTIHSYIAPDSIINTIIEYSLFISVICISIVVTIKAMQFFKDNHRYLIKRYKFAGIIIESCIAIMVAGLVFLNQEITGKFVLFIQKLSLQTHNNKIILLMILLGLYFCLELYHSQEVEDTISDTTATRKTIRFHLIALILKLCIIIGTAIGFIDPVMQILKPEQFKQFDSLIFHFTTTDFFLYMHTIIMTLLGLWITIGIYYVYKFYRK